MIELSAKGDENIGGGEADSVKTENNSRVNGLL